MLRCDAADRPGRSRSRFSLLAGWLVVALATSSTLADDAARFEQAAAIFEGRCISCHNSHGTQRGDLSLDQAATALKPADRSAVIVPGDPDASRLIDMVTGPDAKMPERGEPLSPEQVEVLRTWIAAGAHWPEGRQLVSKPDISTDWWSLNPLDPQPVPTPDQHADWVRNPIDAFVLEKLLEQGMQPSEPADRRTLIRRVYFDLIGLPPTPEQVEAFIADDDPLAYEKLVDELLASPHYGERWARHWMDIARFAESHGHDEDVPRENAWPYRDYLIRSFNSDKRYSRFIEEQIAGDAIYGDDPWATVALGFLAAGPWDQSSQKGIVDGTEDKKIAQVLDRDDMIAASVGTINSVTIACARCHNHKFDPVTQDDYYALQAVFAGVDRHDVPYDPDPQVHAKRRDLKQRQDELAALSVEQLNSGEYQQRAAQWERELSEGGQTWQILEPAGIETSEGSSPQRLDDHSVLFSGEQETDTYTLTAATDQNRVTAVRIEVLTHESLPENGPGRAVNGNLHLSEFELYAAPAEDADAEPRRVRIASAFADFNQDGWTIEHALDGNPQTAWGIFPQTGEAHEAVFVLAEPLELQEGERLRFVLKQLHGGSHIIGRPRLSATTAADPRSVAAPPAEVAAILSTPGDERTDEQRAQLARFVLQRQIEQELAALPKPKMVYAVTTDFPRAGNYVPANGPRPVHVLERGDITQPRELAEPGAIGWFDDLPARFDLDDPSDEAARRVALARWLSDDRNVMTWRSIVNRTWHYHLGRGIVATPNDFGRMGAEPTHPELLDYLARWFRDDADQSFKQLHRLIVTSATYRQASTHRTDYAAVDAENRYLWRMNRQRLEAEQVADAVLAISGKLDRTMHGPSVKQFIQTPGIHETPNVDYQNFDVDNPANHRRSIYRFHFRTLPDPMMEALDCPTGSQATPVRSDSVTPLQALAMMNSPFMTRQAEHIAERLKAAADDTPGRVRELYQLTLQREPTAEEMQAVTNYADTHGLAATARLILNTNAFMFLD